MKGFFYCKHLIEFLIGGTCQIYGRQQNVVFFLPETNVTVSGIVT